MKKIILIVITAAVFVGLVVFINRSEEPPIENGADERLTQEEREAIVSSYIEENISDLSPVPEVLGGTFIAINIEFTGANSGIVEYEDGHIALVADFEYTIDEEGAVEVVLTDVRENQP